MREGFAISPKMPIVSRNPYLSGAVHALIHTFMKFPNNIVPQFTPLIHYISPFSSV